MTVQGVPGGDHAETDQPKRHGPFHSATCPKTGLSHPDDLARVSEGLLDSPAGCVPGHHVFRGGFEIGGHQRQPVAAVVTVSSPRFVITDQDDAHGVTAKRAIPETGQFVICTVSVRPYRRTRVSRHRAPAVALVARSVGVPNRGPRVRGRPDRPVRGGGSSCSTEVTFNRLVQVIRVCRLRSRSPT